MQHLTTPPNDDQPRRPTTFFLDGGTDVLEGRSNDALVRARGALDDGAGRLWWPGESLLTALLFMVRLGVGVRVGERIDKRA